VQTLALNFNFASLWVSFLEKWQEQEILVVVSCETKETTMVEKTKFVRFAQLKNPPPIFMVNCQKNYELKTF